MNIEPPEITKQASKITYRVELLSDADGVYGVTGREDGSGKPKKLITRPDKLDLWSGELYALQRIPRPNFCRTVEGYFADALHRAMCARHGLIDEEYCTWRSWSETPDPKRARQVWHGLRRLALGIVNKLIDQALAVGEPRAMKAARRFPIRFRASLYNSFCRYGERAMQLSESFPLLAVMLFANSWMLSDYKEEDTIPVDFEQQKRESNQVRQRHIELVLSGERLKRISDSLRISYLFRRVTPRATGYVITTDISDEALGHIPSTTRKQRLFFAAIRLTEKLGPSFTTWSANQAANMTSLNELSEFEDIADWVRACGIQEAEIELALPWHVRRLILERSTDLIRRNRGAEFVTRRFSPNMSLKTVRRLSQEWHEAIANNFTEGELIKFPAPWMCGEEMDGHKIVPITDSRELYLAGKALHNCAGSYADQIFYGRSCLYTVLDGDERPVVMVEIARTDSDIELVQIKGPCNAQAPEEIETAVRKWFNRNKQNTKLLEWIRKDSTNFRFDV